MDRRFYLIKIAGYRLLSSRRSTLADRSASGTENGPVKSDSKNKGKLVAKCKALLNDKNYDLALEVLNQLVELDPDNHSYFITLGEVYQKRGQVKFCIEALEKAVYLDPEHPGLQVRLADICYESKDFGKAKLNYGSALFNERDPELLAKCRKKVLVLNNLVNK